MGRTKARPASAALRAGLLTYRERLAPEGASTAPRTLPSKTGPGKALSKATCLRLHMGTAATRETAAL